MIGIGAGALRSPTHPIIVVVAAADFVACCRAVGIHLPLLQDDAVDARFQEGVDAGDFSFEVAQGFGYLDGQGWSWWWRGGGCC